MTNSSRIYSPLDIVVVPFPFTDRDAHKRRPALVISSKNFNQKSGHSVLAMITGAKHSAWPLDVSISDYRHAGLPKSCIVRMKLFTLDHQLIIHKAGTLSANDKDHVKKSLNQLICLKS